MVVIDPSRLSSGDTDQVIHREDKGLTMTFYSECVVKHYDTPPTYITPEDQNRRLMNEIAAYQHLKELHCPFVPDLIDFSIEDRWLCISRIHGHSLLVLSQSSKNRLPVKSILIQLDQMNDWLRSFGFGDMGNNIKDVIMSESGKLYLVDFEPYSDGIKTTMNPDIYNALIYDILDRVLVRKSRKARLTPQFIRLSLGILSKRPLKTITFALRHLFPTVCRVYHLAKQRIRCWLNKVLILGIGNIK